MPKNMGDDQGFGTQSVGNKTDSGYPGKCQAEGDAQGFQSGDSPNSGDGAGKGAAQEQGFAKGMK